MDKVARDKGVAVVSRGSELHDPSAGLGTVQVGCASRSGAVAVAGGCWQQAARWRQAGEQGVQLCFSWTKGGGELPPYMLKVGAPLT